jgi:D-glycero-D-manno-heptose 1,7-bisphosphate phosphatase
LDRDNTLIEDPGYLNHPEQVKLVEGVVEALTELKGLGYKLVVVSNQSAVARGIVTEQVLGEIHEHLQQLLAEEGARLDRIYYCPYHPEGVVARYRKDSDWRKPKPGMLLAAAEEMDIDLGQSWMIGNGDIDIEAGFRAGCKTILIDPSSQHKPARPDSAWTGAKPDHRSVNLREAVNIIKKYHRSPMTTNSQLQSASPPQAQAPAEATEQPPAVESQPVPMPPPQPEVVAAQDERTAEPTEQLLSGILEQLKKMQRTEMFGEFSVMRLLAGIVQIVVLFCLLMAIWFLTSPGGPSNGVLIALGFAAVLQLMSLTFYVMQGRK